MKGTTMKNPFAVYVEDFEWARCPKLVYAEAIVQLWNRHSGEAERARVVDMRIKRCSECDRATGEDPCAACEAYAEHTAV